MSDLVVCVDVGSTFTKALLVDLDPVRVVGGAQARTTVDTDVMDGVDACLERVGAMAPGARDAEVLACSSAGGGLRIAVVGNESLVTAEAGRRVALSSGGKVVAVVAAAEGPVTLAALREPDLVLLTGGTDGGNAEVLLDAARGLVSCGWRGPVVVAGNAEVADEVAGVLAGLPTTVTANVVPRIGVLEPAGARAAAREAFLAHVIGGKHLSRGDRFVSLVRGATPDVVLTGVEVLAAETGEDVVVVDVGGATTDVHSVVDLPPPDSGLSREVVAPTTTTRTVEGDLGMRWSAASTVEAADLPDLAAAARARVADPSFVPADDADHLADEAIARAAVGLALRRHAGRARVSVGPDGRVTERTGTDLREVGLLVASGGVFRHGRPHVEHLVLTGSLGRDLPGGWQLPEHPRLVVDRDYLLVAVGLLAENHPDEARRLARRLVGTA